ncbi:MAG: hypothetical protein WCY11_18455, partial [Novosphingobium sp.]
MTNELVFAHRPHVHFAVLPPSEQIAVERPRRLLVARLQLVPRAMADTRHIVGKGQALAFAVGAHDIEQCSLRVADHGNRAHHRDCRRRHYHRAALPGHRGQGRRDVGNRDIAKPGRGSVVVFRVSAPVSGPGF